MDSLSWLLLVLVLLLLLGLAVVQLSSWPVQHVFRDLGIDTPPASRLFGHFLEGVKHGAFDVQSKYHQHFKGKKAYGWYEFRTPVIVLRDLDLLKDVMVKHFGNFTDRRQLFSFEEPFHESLVALLGEHWKRVRNAVSPTFSSGRLKKMSRHVDRSAQSLLRVLNQKEETNEEVELKDIMSRLTMDTIASTGFGLDIDTLGQPDNNEFSDMAKKLGDLNEVMVLANMVSPWLQRQLSKMGMTFMSGHARRFFSSVVDSAIEERKIRGDAGKMHDFLDLVMNIQTDREESGEGKGSNGLTRMEIMGQAILFIFAGYETVSTAISFTLFLLANHPEYQRLVQEELDQKLVDEKNLVPGYESLQNLPFLDQCISETMRIYPPAAFVDRMCTEDITLHGVRFQKGMSVLIPLYALHTDPDIWEEPHQFRPERFEPEAREYRHQFAFMPFGNGPRNCIGMRLAQLELKAVLASVLRLFDVVPCGKTVYPVRLEKLQTKAQDGLWVKLERRKIK